LPRIYPLLRAAFYSFISFGYNLLAMTWLTRARERIRQNPNWKWLYFGLGIKRWLALLFAGMTILGLGFAYLLVEVYRAYTFPAVVYYLTLQFIDRPWRAALFVLLGVGGVVFAIYKLNQAFLSALPPNQRNLVDVLYRRRNRLRGVKVVAIGGGTGLSTLLRGLKYYTENITAIVTVADDGGSSGKLRQELGLLPPGDFRQCIAALAEAEPLMTSLFEYRFGQGGTLNGHSFGNLFIAAMAGVTGNFERGLAEASRVLAVRGQIVPSTLQNLTLGAELKTGGNQIYTRVQGESRLAKQGAPVSRVFLNPENPPAYPGAIRAILDADLIIAGPGSLYTSVLPNLLVPNIAAALAATPAPKIYVCNIATEHGETDGMDAREHARALEEHMNARVFDTVLVNDDLHAQLPPQAQIEYIRADEQAPYQFVNAAVAEGEHPWRHDPDKLAREIFKWYAGQKKKAKFVQEQVTSRQRESSPVA
jgi:uncharacterized cofD-like protein